MLQTAMLMLSLFEQPLPYTMDNPGGEPIDSPDFVQILLAIDGGRLVRQQPRRRAD